MQRESVIDIVKGIGILLVVLAHTPQLPYPIQKYIYAFHMPLFFILSGYVFDEDKYLKNSFKTFLRGKFQRLIIPYFAMATICYLLFIILPTGVKFVKTGGLDYGTLARYGIGILYSRGTVEWLPNSSPLWFLTALFCAENLFFIIIKYFKVGRPVLIALCAVSGYVTSIFVPFKLPWNIDTALTAVVFMHLGLLLRTKNGLSLIRKTRAYYLLPIVSISLLASKYNDIRLINFDGNRYGNVFLMYLGAITGSYLVIYLATRIEQLDAIKFFGANTLPIMGFNYAAISVASRVFPMFKLSYHWWLSFLIQMYLLVVLLLVLKRMPTVYNLLYGKIDISRQGITGKTG